MPKFKIEGGNPLSGSINVRGAKNHAIKLFPASILVKNKVFLENVPDIQDVQVMAEILKYLGAQVEKTGNDTYTIDTSGISHSEIPSELVMKMRASFLFLGPLLSRFDEVKLAHPGGDAIGKRPIDLSLDFLRCLGAEILVEKDAYVIKKVRELQGCDYTFTRITHTGTEFAIMSALAAQGVTHLYNCALEPEVTALCENLIQSGAQIEGVGTDTLIIYGEKDLKNESHWKIIPDRLELGTFVILAALNKSPLHIYGGEPEHLRVFWEYMKKCNIPFRIDGKDVYIDKTEKILPYDMTTHEYPGFATDLQSPYTLLMTQAEGLSLIHETIFDGRLFFADKLVSMGANITMCDPHRVLVHGKTELYAKYLASPDVRVGITFLLAGSIAHGVTEIDNIYHIKRGYDTIVQRLQNIGMKIEEIA